MIQTYKSVISLLEAEVAESETRLFTAPTGLFLDILTQSQSPGKHGLKNTGRDLNIKEVRHEKNWHLKLSGKVCGNRTRYTD